MNKEVVDYVIEKTKDLMDSPSCCPEAKKAAQNWLDAVGTENEAAETKKYIAELEGDIMPIDMLISFTESDQGVKAFGAETAKEVAEHGKKIRAAGAKYCDCSACAACAAILEKKELLGV